MTLSEQSRFVRVDAALPDVDLARAVLVGLAAEPKELPCRLFYDDEGSRLFGAICATPEYYPTRTERAILARHAQEIAAEFAEHDVVELGSGSAEKTELILAARLAHGPCRYVPIDISADALERSSARLLEAHPDLSITAIAAEYARGVALSGDHTHGSRLVLCLGSGIGNFERLQATVFLHSLHEHLRPNDALLLGVDLRKERAVLEAAYDDAQGVTAAFNKNVLARINRELGGEFDLDLFRHAAPYDEEEGRIALYLVSRADQRVRIAALERSFDFGEGEPIHTEYSHKYSPGELEELASASGFRLERTYHDDERRFAVCLLRA